MPGGPRRAQTRPTATTALRSDALPSRRHPLFTAAVAGLVPFTTLILLNPGVQSLA